ncbi:MAG: tryptophan 7-halogenase [Acidobacteria bacterium]|nr:tryptophan 7-halogenase [Acidobacteriota bacterium]
MKLAVVGGGTAGFMAAAHLSKRFPELELVHVFDSGHPPLGVGEGTLPAFPPWLHRVTGLELPELVEACDTTYKLGIRFEGWGSANPVFFHNFGAGSYAYHLSAEKLPALLDAGIHAERIDRRVRMLVSDGRRVELRFEDGGPPLVADLVVDARGFPGALDDGEHLGIRGIPTNAALLRRGPAGELLGGTRAVARPHGWIFVIPLARHTSYGYVFDERTSSAGEVSAEFDRFLDEDGVDHGTVETTGERLLRFPSFRRRSFFDGALFHLGNGASFLEPLEATAIGLVLHQLQVLTYWLADELVGVSGDEKRSTRVLAEIDRELGGAVDAVGLFVAWHYLAGSAWETPFWQSAREGAERVLASARGTDVGARFEVLLAMAREIPEDAVANLRDREVFEHEVAPVLRRSARLKHAFGGFDAASFAQVGRGLGLLG